MSEGERRLAAIMYTDIVGFTALTQKDESSTLQILEKHRSLLRPHFLSHGGREIKTTGDGFIIEFQSALDAVLCAVAIQQMMHDRKLSTGETISHRIGIHVGDVVEKGNDILGDAVNVASRIEPLAMPGGICISEQVYDHVKNKFEFPLTSVGKRELKNVGEPMEVYKVVMPWEQATKVETPSFATNRIAILPFTSFSPDPNDAFFADGVTDEIISAVAGISGFNVVSRTSVVGYKGTTKKVEEIGRELKVGSILEGTFKKAGNRIRVTTQLIDVAEDRHLWAQSYDRNLDDIFEVQSDVAKQVADALRVRILSAERVRVEKRPTESTAAFTLYLRGRQLWNKRELNDIKEALAYFERAVKEDPNFALGYVGVSDSCSILGLSWRVDPEANLIRAKAMVDKALELDPDLAEAHASRAGLLLDVYDFRNAEEEFRKAIELKPSYAMAHLWYFLLLLRNTRWDEAREQIEKALELDPLSPVIHTDYGWYYWCAKKDYARAIEPTKRAIELGMTSSHEELAWVYGRMKKFDDMRREYATWVELSKDSVPNAQLYADLSIAYFTDDKKTVGRLLPELEAHFGEDLGPDAKDIGAYHFYLGESDKGFEWLERSYHRKEPLLPLITFDSPFDGIRSDPRYFDLLKRLGLDQASKSPSGA